MVSGLITQTLSTILKHPKVRKEWDKLICQEALEPMETDLGLFNNPDLFQLCLACYLLKADRVSLIPKATMGMHQRASFYTQENLRRTKDLRLETNTLAVGKV